MTFKDELEKTLRVLYHSYGPNNETLAIESATKAIQALVLREIPQKIKLRASMQVNKKLSSGGEERRRRSILRMIFRLQRNPIPGIVQEIDWYIEDFPDSNTKEKKPKG